MTNDPIYRPLSILSSTVLLAACANTGGLFERQQDRIAIVSDPPNAQVWIMGKQYGMTPSEVPTDVVFPRVYAPEDEALYGKIRLLKQGCEAKTVTVTATALSAGIDARLECRKKGPHVSRPSEATTEPQAPIYPKSVRDRLIELNELRSERLITEVEYQRLRQRVLDTL